MEQRFACTACGACCHGWLPLTLDDAVEHVGRFPLAMVWTPLRQGARAFAHTARLGTTVRLRDRKTLAVVIAPTAYIPPSFPCPELQGDGRCGIHVDKPSRCRAMPFYPYREEADQADMLIPRKGWACDTSAAAPVVYRDRRIVERADFDREHDQLQRQAPALRGYAEYALKYMPWILDSLTAAAARPAAGGVVTSLSSFLTAARRPDTAALAARQEPVLAAFAARTAGDPELVDYHRNYVAWGKEMANIARRAAATEAC
jgi:Fe-S-cluster containining protein